MIKTTMDVGGKHVLIEDPDGHVARIPTSDLEQLLELLAAIEPTDPGARRRDRDGDVWTLRGDGFWGGYGVDPRTWDDVKGTYGPLYPVTVPE